MIINILTTAVTSCLQKPLLCLQTSSSPGCCCWLCCLVSLLPPEPHALHPHLTHLSRFLAPPSCQHSNIRYFHLSPFSKHSPPFQPQTSLATQDLLSAHCLSVSFSPSSSSALMSAGNTSPATPSSTEAFILVSLCSLWDLSPVIRD